MAQRFLDPDGLTRLGNLEFVARQVVEGYLTGRHRSPYQGFSVEYLDHRPYTTGDEVRALDWKLLARTDKYYIKLFEDETNLSARIILDCSGSMDYKNPERRLTKLEYASYLAAALAHLLIRQNDAVGLTTFDSEVRATLPPRARPTQFRRILEVLEAAKPGGETRLGPVLHEVAERLQRRGLVILISDLIDEPEAIADGLRHFRHNKQEVLVFQVMDDDELSFPYDRLTRFKDMEGAGRLTANPKRLRDNYLNRLGQFIEAIRAACYDCAATHCLVNTKESYDEFLAAYLEKRSRLG